MVVDKAIESTERYLTFLKNTDQGIEPLNVTHLAQNPEKVESGGEIYCLYTCNLPPRRRIPPDSYALFRPTDDPQREFWVQIAQYDRTSGRAKILMKDKISAPEGTLEIDFKWLVERMLEWLQKRGKKVMRPEELTGNSINILRALDVCNGLGRTYSEEQLDAIRATLTANLSYIWGPPGTGKTQYVLAPAVHAVMEQGKKVLVLASTNLAVDNALRSVLELGLEISKVLRVGYPSERFLGDYPECCELRAFQDEIKHKEDELKTREQEGKDLRELANLPEKISRTESELNAARHDFTEKNKQYHALKRAFEEKSEEANREEIERGRTCDDIVRLSTERDEFGLSHLESQVEALQDEQADLIADLSKANQRLEKMCLLVRLFTSKRKLILEEIEGLEKRLKLVEATLEAKLDKRAEIMPRFKALEEEINALQGKEDRLAEKIEQLREGLDEKEFELKLAGEELTFFRQKGEALSASLDSLNLRSSELAERYGQPGDEQIEGRIASCESRIRELREQIEQFRIDLSKVRVFGMTFDTFIGMMFEPRFHVDWVFIDEAPYAPVVKMLPVLSLGCPIAMLGDEKQLPPICQNDDNAMIRAFWAKGAIFIEDVFRLEGDHDALYQLEEPGPMQVMQKRTLRSSYRFGATLADILDRHIYNIRLEGLANVDTEIFVSNCPPRLRQGQYPRQNYDEAEKIVSFIRDFVEKYPLEKDRPQIVVLTPYKTQALLIQHKLSNHGLQREVEVLNTHKSQGREWDIVLFSVADTAQLGNQWLPFFTDSTRAEGRAVLNTTISRAKKKLIVFLDLHYWRIRPGGCLLREIAETMPQLEI